jgi:hypothetical protein
MLQKFDQTDMGNPIGKASGRTFNRISTCVPDTCWTSLSVPPSHTLKISNRSPSEGLKIGLPVAVDAMMRFIVPTLQGLLIVNPTVNFQFPDPVDPFGKTSGRNLLTIELTP